MLKKITLYSCFIIFSIAIFILMNQFLATGNMDFTGIDIQSVQFNPYTTESCQWLYRTVWISLQCTIPRDV